MKKIFTGLSLMVIVPALMVFVSTVLSASGSGSNWPQWRGPDSRGVSEDSNLPTEWSETKNVLWKTAIPGTGFSQPIIWGNRVFLTTDIDGDPAPETHKAPVYMIGGKEFKHPDWDGIHKLHTFKTLALDRDSGKILWEKTSYEGKVFDYRHRRGNYAAPTPVTDGTYMYAYFGTEGLYCYDFNGKLIWKKHIDEIPTIGMGVGTSPILYKDLLILQCDQDVEPKDSFITALDKKTGKEVWKVSRPVQVSWTTPVIIKTDKRDEMVTSGNEFLISYDPATGKELWRATGLKSHAIATPVFGHGLAILSSGFPSKVIKAIRLGGSGNLDDTENIVWQYNKGTSYVPSPILYGDYLYLMSDAGILTCLNAKTGEIVYEGGRVPVPAKFYGASPVAFGGKILLTNDDGDTFVIKAGPKHEVLGTNSVGEPVRTSIAIADDKLFIRGSKHLFCISAGG